MFEVFLDEPCFITRNANLTAKIEKRVFADLVTRGKDLNFMESLSPLNLYEFSSQFSRRKFHSVDDICDPETGSRIAGIEVKDYNDIDLKKVFLLQGYNGDPDY